MITASTSIAVAWTPGTITAAIVIVAIAVAAGVAAAMSGHDDEDERIRRTFRLEDFRQHTRDNPDKSKEDK